MAPVRRLLSVAIAAVLLAAGATDAGALAFADGDEPAVEHLDIDLSRRVYSDSPNSPPMVHLSIRTFDRWTRRACRRAGCLVWWELDTRGGRRPDRLVEWWPGSRRPHCAVYNLQTPDGALVVRGDAAKYRRNAFCSFPKRYLRLDKPMGWRDSTQWRQDHDIAPDAGFYTTANE